MNLPDPGVVLGALALVLLAGCGSAEAEKTPEVLGAIRLGEMAEQQLQSEHPRLAPGTMACANLDFRVGAEVRCVRTAVLSGGRQIRVHGTVRVTSVEDGGKLHVKLDDEVAEFGVAGEYLEDAVTRQIVTRTEVRPDGVECPYLSGPVGTGVGCWATFGNRSMLVRVTVTALDPRTYTTRYGFTKDVFDKRYHPDLAGSLTYLRAHGWAA